MWPFCADTPDRTIVTPHPYVFSLAVAGSGRTVSPRHSKITKIAVVTTTTDTTIIILIIVSTIAIVVHSPTTITAVINAKTTMNHILYVLIAHRRSYPTERETAEL